MTPISQGLKLTFLIHFFAGSFFGVLDIFFPVQWGSYTNWPVQDPTPYRLVGAAILAFGLSSFLAYRERWWEKVILLVRTEIIWTGFATLVFLAALIFEKAPAIAWLYAALMAGFCVAFAIFQNPVRSKTG